jgi:hypothetical protein
MSIASLSRFTVPLASDQSASTQGMLMPKLQYRFRVMFEGIGVSGSTTELTKQVMDVSKPNVEMQDQTIEVYNSIIHYAGKPKWGALEVNLRDDVTGAVSKLVGEQMQKQFDFFEQSSAAAGGDYKFTMRIEQLDGGNGGNPSGGPNVLETWEVYGCYISKVDYGKLAYKQQEAVSIKLTVVFDNAQQVGASAGFGTPGFAGKAPARGTNTLGG